MITHNELGYKELYERVCNEFNKSHWFSSGPLDETFYTMRVYETLKELIKESDKSVDEHVLLTASILHDVGKCELESGELFTKHGLKPECGEEFLKHGEKSAGIARRILEEIDCSEEFISRVCHLVEYHDIRSKEDKSVELKLLQDADLIADMGVADFIRPFLWSGKFNRPVVESIKFMKDEGQGKSIHDLNLEVSKKLAKKEYEIKNKLLEDASELIRTDLLE